ncbi:MAG TPA: PGF-CTERM sorting domain-containing protein [Methanosarcinaceae archaeon]|nr:PGF-CTERM sorting domain-containing protein [Methanosarcinaceae archaeon]
MNKNKHVNWKRNFITGICFAAALMVFAVLPAQAQQPAVSIIAPEWVEGTTCYATVEINNISNLDAGQFDLSFNSSVLKVVDVGNGDIQGTEIPVQWNSIETGMIRVIFNLEGVTGISGSGQLAKIDFEVVGPGDSTIGISNELLVNTQANKINADWGVTAATGAHKSTPGFGAVFALVGLVAVFCMVRSSRKS